MVFGKVQAHNNNAEFYAPGWPPIRLVGQELGGITSGQPMESIAMNGNVLTVRAGRKKSGGVQSSFFNYCKETAVLKAGKRKKAQTRRGSQTLGTIV